MKNRSRHSGKVEFRSDKSRLGVIFSPKYRQVKIIITILIILLLLVVVKPYKNLGSSFSKPSITSTLSPSNTLPPTPTLEPDEEAKKILKESSSSCPSGQTILDWLKSVIGKESIPSKEESSKAKQDNLFYWACYIANENEYHKVESTAIADNSNISDPLQCQINQSCGGGSIPLKLSECKNSTCCQIGDRWIFYSSISKCKQDQEAYYNDPEVLVTCPSRAGNIIVKRNVCRTYVDCPDGKGGYIFTSSDNCNKLWELYKEQLTQLAREYTNALLEQQRLNSLSLQLELQKMNNQVLPTIDWIQYEMGPLPPPIKQFENLILPCPTAVKAYTGEVFYQAPCPQP